MSAVAPPPIASEIRALVSERPSKNLGEVIPWSSATTIEAPESGSTSRLKRICFPTEPLTCNSCRTHMSSLGALDLCYFQRGLLSVGLFARSQPLDHEAHPVRYVMLN